MYRQREGGAGEREKRSGRAVGISSERCRQLTVSPLLQSLPSSLFFVVSDVDAKLFQGRRLRRSRTREGRSGSGVYLRERKRGQRDRERKRGRRQGSGRGAGEERDWGGGEESFFDNQEGRGERGPKDTLTHTKNPPPHHLIHFKGSSEAITSNDWTAFFNFCQYPRGPFYRLFLSPTPLFSCEGCSAGD